MAATAGSLSDHPTEKTGALLVDNDGRIKGTGYWRTDSPGDWYLDPIEILILDTKPADRKGSTIYTNGPITRSATEMLALAGVRRVVLHGTSTVRLGTTSRIREGREGIPFMVTREIQVDEVTDDLNSKQGENKDERQENP